ncbi:MAG: hypothetical protein WBW33_24325 [Bryobacteraceae bacterium]
MPLSYGEEFAPCQIYSPILAAKRDDERPQQCSDLPGLEQERPGIQRASAPGPKSFYLAKCSLLWALALSGACQAQSVAAAAPAGSDDPQLPAIALAFLVVPVLIYIVRRRLIAHIGQQMMVASTGQQVPDTEEALADEVDAGASLQLVFHDADEAPVGKVNLRLGSEQRLFRLICLADFGIGIGYAGLPLLFGLFAFHEPAQVGLAMGVVVAVFTVVRFLLYQGQFRAYNLNRSRKRQRVYRWFGRIGYGILALVSLVTGATATNLVYLPDILRAIFGPRVRMILSVLLVAGAVVYAVPIVWAGPDARSKAEAFGLLCAASLHAIFFTLSALRLRKVGGLRLLILRVFSIDQTSSFIFSGLMRYWRHFGNHFTVVDQSLVRQGYSNSLTKTVFLAFFLIAVLVVAFLGSATWLESLIHHPLAWGWNCLLVIVLAALAALASLSIGKRRIDSRFTRSIDQLQASLRSVEERPRGLDLSFRHLRALVPPEHVVPRRERVRESGRRCTNGPAGLLRTARGLQERGQFLVRRHRSIPSAVPGRHSQRPDRRRRNAAGTLGAAQQDLPQPLTAQSGGPCLPGTRQR